MQRGAYLPHPLSYDNHNCNCQLQLRIAKQSVQLSVVAYRQYGVAVAPDRLLVPSLSPVRVPRELLAFAPRSGVRAIMLVRKHPAGACEG
jgi:hypothetical protein